MTTHDEERQIDHHAYIAATVAVFVAGAELAITEWVSEAWHQSRLWTFVAGLGAILFLFFLVFRIIRWHERRWHRKEAKRRDEAEAKAIELATVGCVVLARRHLRHPHQAARRRQCDQDPKFGPRLCRRRVRIRARRPGEGPYKGRTLRPFPRSKSPLGSYRLRVCVRRQERRATDGQGGRGL